MIYGKEECKRLAVSKAAVLVLDTYAENGTPVVVTRRVIGCGAIRSGRASNWYVKFDKVLQDGCDGACFPLLLGGNTGDSLDITNLVRYINSNYSYLPYHERQMLISDAKLRLKEAR